MQTIGSFVLERVEVINAVSLQIRTSEGDKLAPRELDIDGRSASLPGTAVLFDRSAKIVSGSPFAFYHDPSEGPWLEVEISGVESHRTGQSCALEIVGDPLVLIKSEPEILAERTTFRFLNWFGPVPAGMFDRFRPRILCSGSKGYLVASSVTLEAYYIPVRKMPAIYHDGIPLLLLRMFVLAQGMKHWARTEIQSFVRLVTNICHGSQAPFDGEACHTSSHWLRYNVYSGGSAFSTPEDGTHFNLEKWLDAYRSWARDQIKTSVNCYDQAGIAEAALCLGLPFEQIHWEFHQVYGFIDKETQLVGWGSCNNPYFGDDVTKAVLFKDAKDDEPAEGTAGEQSQQNIARSPFRNHAYLSWTSKPLSEEDYKAYSELLRISRRTEWGVTRSDYQRIALKFEEQMGITMYMIDACGGPHTGDETRAQYEAKIEEVPGDPTTSYSSYVSENSKASPNRWKSQHYLGPGPAVLYDGLSTADQDQYNKDRDFVIEQTHMSRTTRVFGLRISKIRAILEKHFADEEKWPNKRWASTLRPYKVGTAGTVIYEIKFAETFPSVDGHKQGHSVNTRIAINPDGEQLRKPLGEHLAFKLLTSRQHTMAHRGYAKSKREGSMDPYHDMASIVGSYTTRAFCYGSVSVEVATDDDSYWEENDNSVFSQILQYLSDTGDAQLHENWD